MVLVDATAWVLKANVCTTWVYFPTWTSSRAQNNHANGGGVGSSAISENLWEANACALIVCSSYNVSQSLAMYQ
jgi:hypothetical protein